MVTGVQVFHIGLCFFIIISAFTQVTASTGDRHYVGTDASVPLLIIQLSIACDICWQANGSYWHQSGVPNLPNGFFPYGGRAMVSGAANVRNLRHSLRLRLDRHIAELHTAAHHVPAIL